MLRSKVFSPIVSSWRRLSGSAVSSWRGLSPRARTYAVGALVLVAVGLFAFPALHGDPVERAVARGDLAGAKRELQHRQTAHLAVESYDAGRVAEAQKSFRSAATSYAAAAQQGDARGLDRLIALSHDRECPARSAAAVGLSKLHDERAVHALQKLTEARFEDGKSRHAGICDSRRAAREALKHARKA
jgi:HEAT repeat protein